MNNRESGSATGADGAPTLPAGMRNFAFPEESLKSTRQALYSPQGPGYVLIRGFAPPELAMHMRRFWTSGEPQLWDAFEQLRNRPRYRVGDGPFASHFKGKDAYLFALWNQPVDDVTLAAVVAAVQLRNQIEQQPLFRDLLPVSRYMAFYMVTLSRDSAANEVEWHEDLFAHDESLPYVETRLQATLFLSAYGEDYEGSGMRLIDNQGREIQIDEALRPRAGDLLLWRYGNRHCVGSVNALPGGVGFARILMPLEAIELPTRPSAIGTDTPRSETSAQDGTATGAEAARAPAPPVTRTGWRALLRSWLGMSG